MAISGTATMFSRLTKVRSVVKCAGNASTIAPSFNGCSVASTRLYSVDIDKVIDTGSDIKANKSISKAMRAYLQRAREYNEFMKKEVTEYEIGKRHLANMMGEDPETFTQKDIREAIKYLFPSGLYDKHARPKMEPPEEIFPPRKAAQFDESGRPHHFLFYTAKPNFYEVLHEMAANITKLNDIEDENMKKDIVPEPSDSSKLLGSEWMQKADLEKMLLESIHDKNYEKFIAVANRLVEHPYVDLVHDFVMKYRSMKLQQSSLGRILKPTLNEAGRPFISVKNCRRKSARADVTVLGEGSGKITINGKDIRYFLNIQSREQNEKRKSDLVVSK